MSGRWNNVACMVHGGLDLRREPQEPPALQPTEVLLKLGAVASADRTCRFFLGSASVFPHAQGMFRSRVVTASAAPRCNSY